MLQGKQYNNDICRDCYAKNIAKYGKFSIKCTGITVEDDVKFAISQGLTEEDARWLYDPRYFFKKVYGSAPRSYQEPILLCSANSLVARQCRQTGKTLTIIMKIMHFLATNDNETVLVITPNESQVKKIYEEYVLRDCIYKNDNLKESVVSKTQKPYYKVEFCNGSKIQLMIAGESVRGMTSSWLYIDEAAIIGSELLNSILMTTASKGNSVIIQTSTPKGRGNQFYKACKEYADYNEYHVSIYDVAEMQKKVEAFRRTLGEAGFKQEAEAEFPDISGSPFNYAGIDAAQKDYEYEQCTRQDGIVYIGGVDWNGPTIGTYIVVIGFDPNTYNITVVDKKVVSSANWNSLAAKQGVIDMNRKWNCKHWMVDYGYGLTIVEEIRAYSMKIAHQLGSRHPDSQLKYIIDTVEFGSLMTITDPFTKEEQKKTTKSFIVNQFARLFEPDVNKQVAFSYPRSDEEITKSLENYKLMNVTARGFEQYGFAKDAGIEDHMLDALGLAVFGVIKYYNELFKRVILQSVPIASNGMLLSMAGVNPTPILDVRGKNITLISDNDQTPIEFDEKPLNYAQNIRSQSSRTFGKAGIVNRKFDSQSGLKGRGGIVKRTMGY
jgi:hypothetical protein